MAKNDNKQKENMARQLYSAYVNTAMKYQRDRDHSYTPFDQNHGPAKHGMLAVADFVLALVGAKDSRIAELEATVADYQHTYDTAMAGKCTDGHGHCECVWAMQRRIAELEAQAKKDNLALRAAKELADVSSEFIEWNKKYPSNRIYGEIEIRRIAKELDGINEKTIKALSKFREATK